MPLVTTHRISSLISFLQGFFCLLVVAATAGFLGALRFTEASGIGFADPYWQSRLVFFGGVAFALLTFVALFLLVKTTRAVAVVLARTRARLPVPLAATLVACGTLCVVAALGLCLWHAATSSDVSATGSAPSHPVEKGPSMQTGMTSRVTLHTGGSLMFHILTICVFLGGVAMVVLGTWSSLQSGHDSGSVQANPDGGEH